MRWRGGGIIYEGLLSVIFHLGEDHLGGGGGGGGVGNYTRGGVGGLFVGIYRSTTHS